MIQYHAGKIFQVKTEQYNPAHRDRGGIITFLTMSYILAVNPQILGETGMDKGALFTTTALAAIAGTLFMALIANVPIAQAPGMGLNNFFAFSVVIAMGHRQFALTGVLLSGLCFMLLTIFNIRKIIVDNIPVTLKNAIPIGIGLFITLIGLKSAGIVTPNEFTLVQLGNMADPNVWIAVLGLVVIAVLLVKKVHGAILIGIIVSTPRGILGLIQLPQGSWVTLPPSLEPIFFKFEWSSILTSIC